MSEKTNNEKENIVPLSDGETVIAVEKIEDLKEAVAKVKAEVKAEIKVEEPKAVADNVIEAAAEPAEVIGLGPVGNGAMGVATFKEEKKPAPIKKAKKEETVAIHSTRNVTWSGIGKVYIGYNIVSKEASEKWLTRDHTRLATPEEVAQEFGN